MIFVALGTQKFQMNRLLEKLDSLVKEGKVNDSIFAQTGNSDYIPKYYSFVHFLEKKDFEKEIRDCDVLITHGGVSTIITGVTFLKPVIVVPRLSEFGEHVDNHQVQIARSFKKLNYVLMCDNIDDLDRIIDESRVHKFETYHSQREHMIKTIDDYLNSIDAK